MHLRTLKQFGYRHVSAVVRDGPGEGNLEKRYAFSLTATEWEQLREVAQRSLVGEYFLMACEVHEEHVEICYDYVAFCRKQEGVEGPLNVFGRLSQLWEELVRLSQNYEEEE